MLKKVIVGVLLLSVLIPVCFAANDIAKPAVTASGAPQITASSPSYYADMWYRDSAERNAIYREVFLLAEQQIRQQVIEQKLKPHQWGVIVDIDETTLDNSVWNYQHDIQGKQQDWNAFAATSQSVPTPGVKKLINAIHQMGGYINLVSNRPISLQAATEKNLKNQGIYFDQVLLDATNASTSFVDKNPRFTAILNGKTPSKLPAQKILAWFGDNIQDFPGLYQKQMIQQNPNGNAYKDFGVRFFALPNPMYGSWEANQFH